jgi:hypothetical protein
VGQLTSFPDPLDATWPPNAVGGKECGNIVEGFDNLFDRCRILRHFQKPSTSSSHHIRHTSAVVTDREQVEKGNIQALHDGQQPI